MPQKDPRARSQLRPNPQNSQGFSSYETIRDGGLSSERLAELDALTDRQFLYATQRMELEEKEQLFRWEKQRLRTFKALWPLEGYVNGAEIAKQGFFYTGSADRVQCVFCSGILRNWERGDDPKTLHRSTFPYCKFAQDRPCGNVPLDVPIGGDLMTINTQQLTADSSVRPDRSGSSMGIVSADRPDSVKYSVVAVRRGSYRGFPQDAGVQPDELSLAGFFYTGTDDKVQCFHCSGVIGMWNPGEVAWEEHAKWFPGCGFLIQTKGVDFIKKCRSRLTAEEREIASQVEYKHVNLDFLDQNTDGPTKPFRLRPFVTYCLELGYSEQTIEKALRINGGDFADAMSMLALLYQIEDGDISADLNAMTEEPSNQPENMQIDTDSPPTTVTAKRPKTLRELITQPADLSEEECEFLRVKTLCENCKQAQIGAVVLPCSCFCLCSSCSDHPRLPRKCPKCKQVVQGAIRVILS